MEPMSYGEMIASHLAETRAQAAIERASWEADQRGQARAGSGHLLLGVLAIEGGQARALLERLGVTPDSARQALDPLLVSDADS